MAPPPPVTIEQLKLQQKLELDSFERKVAIARQKLHAEHRRQRDKLRVIGLCDSDDESVNQVPAAQPQAVRPQTGPSRGRFDVFQQPLSDVVNSTFSNHSPTEEPMLQTPTSVIDLVTDDEAVKTPTKSATTAQTTPPTTPQQQAHTQADANASTPQKLANKQTLDFSPSLSITRASVAQQGQALPVRFQKPSDRKRVRNVSDAESADDTIPSTPVGRRLPLSTPARPIPNRTLMVPTQKPIRQPNFGDGSDSEPDVDTPSKSTNVYGMKAWSRDRLGGDRYLARKRENNVEETPQLQSPEQQVQKKKKKKMARTDQDLKKNSRTHKAIWANGRLNWVERTENVEKMV
ncbi:unnamed protein product [Periconia digitata]|uniref:Uncharacterized protein n=1 Tax=Periconia digitata TaxID=1303443 RepID=A0A9W4UUA4_9PLEO|nr:unnamed protein product [Periconia digitata]